MIDSEGFVSVTINQNKHGVENNTFIISDNKITKSNWFYTIKVTTG